MSKRRITRVFEHRFLSIGEGGLTEAHFDQLVRYNDSHGNQYFDVGHRKVRFKSYVGVIQVGNLILEILPKADADKSPDEEQWRAVLLEMLRVCRYIRVDTLTNAHLRLRSASLLDLYLEAFLLEVLGLLRQGLVKRYRPKEENLTAFRGKLLFARHIARNLVHRERFFVGFDAYDRDNVFNQVLKKALTVLESVGNPHLAVQARQLRLDFDDVQNTAITPAIFRRLRFGRKTDRYRAALQLAELIILNYSPDIRGGQDNVLALLFDMNELFEEYVFRQLRKAAQSQEGIRVDRQVPLVFWRSPSSKRRLRPDIVVEREADGQPEKIVLDTKWKILRDPRPSDEDLRQMYAYHLQFEAERAILLYPQVHDCEDTEGLYSKSAWVDPATEQRCTVQFVDLLDQDRRLRPDLGERILERALGAGSVS